jgi:hypothetical protein
VPRRKKRLVITGDEAAELLGINRDYVRVYLARRGVHEQRGWDPRDIHRLAATRKPTLLEVEASPEVAASAIPTREDLT